MIDNNKPLTQDAIKYFALLAMLLNHIAKIFLQPGTLLWEVFTAIGYFTAVSMIFFLVEGYWYTHSKKGYLARLLIFGIISEIPYCLAFTQNGIIRFCGLNMLFTLSLCFCLIWVMDQSTRRWFKIVFSILALAVSLLCDWAVLAPFYTLLFYWAKGSEKNTRLAFLSAMILFGVRKFVEALSLFTIEQSALFAALSMAGMGAAAVCILYLYNGKRSEKGRTFSKWFFYLFYPLHLLILGLIRINPGLFP